ncbi:MAG: bifunctional methylenetetrahydrofolate dehydrogenase/methenyltetrahydrofolate cyclohydrolase FolD [bacterium]
MSKIIDGKKISRIIKDELKLEVSRLKQKNIIPHLSVILVGDNDASKIYVNMKQKACKKVGIISETIKLKDSVSEKTLLQKIDTLNKNPEIHGILVQLPLPSHINESSVIERITPEKDVDGFHPTNLGRLVIDAGHTFIPATPYGIIELLSRYNITIEGKHVVILGRSNIVGKPLGLLFLRKNNMGNATVTFCHSRTKNLSSITKTADILVAAMGKAEFIKKNMVKSGVIVIDVGINRVEDASKKRGYRLVGDVDFNQVSKISSLITPVPGGVGPMTIAMLLKNTTISAKKNSFKNGK